MVAQIWLRKTFGKKFPRGVWEVNAIRSGDFYSIFEQVRLAACFLPVKYVDIKEKSSRELKTYRYVPTLNKYWFSFHFKLYYFLIKTIKQSAKENISFSVLLKWKTKYIQKLLGIKTAKTFSIVLKSQQLPIIILRFSKIISESTNHKLHSFFRG